MTTGQRLTELYQKIGEITKRLGFGTMSYDEALQLVAELLTSQGDYLDPNAAAQSYLSSAGFNSQADVGKTPPPPVSGPVQTDITKFPNQGARPEEIEPFGAYTRGLASRGLNAGIGGGAFGNYLKNRFTPTNAVFLGQQALRGLLPPGQVAPENAFEQFASQTRGGGLGAQAQTAFQGLLNKQRGGDVNALPFGDPARAFLTPEDDQMAMVASLAREAARGRLGGYAASQLLPSNADLLQQFRGGPSGAQNTALLDYLRAAFGL